MAGDYVEPSRFNTGYLQQAIELAIERQFASPAVLERLTTLLAALRYAEREEDVWRPLIAKVDHMRSGYHWSPENIAWLREQFEKCLAPTPPAGMSDPYPPPEVVRRESVQVLMGILIDQYGADEVAVLMDAALQERMP